MRHTARALVCLLVVLPACVASYGQEPPEILCLNPTVTAVPEEGGCSACPRMDAIFELSDRSLDPRAICTVEPACPYAPGSHAVTVNCNVGVPIQKECQVTVQDVGLSIKPVPGPTPLWPPNHKYQAFDIATDCIGEILQINSCAQPSTPIDPSTTSITIRRVTSSEPEDDKVDPTHSGDGKSCHDMEIFPSRSAFQLRRERLGSGDGRVYTVHYSVVHTPSGQSARSACVYTVAHTVNEPVAENSACRLCVGEECGNCPGPQPSCSEN